MRSDKALRVALVWNGTVMQERTFLLPSEARRVTIGEHRRNDFVLSGENVPESFELFTQHQEGYALNLLPGVGGELNLGDRLEDVADWGGKTLYVVPGHRGRIQIGGITLHFSWVSRDVRAARRGFLTGVDGRLMTALWFSFVAQFIIVFVSTLLWDDLPEPSELSLNSQLLRISAAAPPAEDVPIAPEDDINNDESTSARAEGPEGRMGPPDSEEDETILPDHEGPLRPTLETTDLGQAIDQAMGVDGALSRVFTPNNLQYGQGDDFAIAGEGDVFALAPGSRGMGLRGTDRGGGGNSFGRLGGVGEIDTGPGRSTGTNITRRPQRPVVDVTPTERFVDSGFLSADAIQRVVRNHRRGIRACYERQLLDYPELEGRVVVGWTVGLDGRVIRRTIESDSTDNDELSGCLLREVDRMHFPEPDGGLVIVSFPFVFEVRG